MTQKEEDTALPYTKRSNELSGNKPRELRRKTFGVTSSESDTAGVTEVPSEVLSEVPSPSLGPPDEPFTGPFVKTLSGEILALSETVSKIEETLGGMAFSSRIQPAATSPDVRPVSSHLEGLLDDIIRNSLEINERLSDVLVAILKLKGKVGDWPFRDEEIQKR